jgi:drug/metabolite transporter (DMT)-like permease
MSEARRATLIGVAAALVTVTIWAAWIVATRYAVIGSLTPESVGLLRFGVAAAVLAPVLWRNGVLPRERGNLWLLMLCVLGAGAPFFLIVATGMRFAPAADIAPLLPGTMPLFTALLAAWLDRDRITGLRWIGYALIVLGDLAIAGSDLFHLGSGAWRGHALIVLGAFLWAVYTVAFRRSRIGAIEAAALIAFWSALILLPLGLAGLVDGVRSGNGLEILLQGVLQGVVTGVIALTCYGIAVARLGAARAAAFAALAPALAAVLAVPVLGETPSLYTVIGLIVTSLGVVLASGVFRRT